MPEPPPYNGPGLVALDDRDGPRLAALCIACTGFFEQVGNRAADADTAREILGPPPAVAAGATKHVLGVERGGALIGVIEALQGYPVTRDWYIGLMLLRPDCRGAGLGTALWARFLEGVRAEGAQWLRLVVQHHNRHGLAFWQQQGFLVERTVTASFGAFTGPAWRLVRHADD